jgi:low affinity Fe/Cu permease
MSLGLILVVVLVLLCIGGLPHWGYSQQWNLGYFPSGIGLVLLIILIVVLMNGHI